MKLTSNVGSLFNCTFTSPVSRTPMLNDVNGYYVLLAWGQYTGGNIQQHSGTGRCVTAQRDVVTTASGASTTPTASGTAVAPAFLFIYAMVVLMLASYIYV